MQIGLCICSYHLPMVTSLIKIVLGTDLEYLKTWIEIDVMLFFFSSVIGLLAIQHPIPGHTNSVRHGYISWCVAQFRPVIGWPFPHVSQLYFMAFFSGSLDYRKSFCCREVSQFCLWMLCLLRDVLIRLWIIHFYESSLESPLW